MPVSRGVNSEAERSDKVKIRDCWDIVTVWASRFPHNATSGSRIGKDGPGSVAARQTIYRQVPHKAAGIQTGPIPRYI